MQARPSIQYLLHIVLGNCHEKIPGKVQARPSIQYLLHIVLGNCNEKIPGKVQVQPSTRYLLHIVLGIVMKKIPGKMLTWPSIIYTAYFASKWLLVKCRLTIKSLQFRSLLKSQLPIKCNMFIFQLCQSHNPILFQYILIDKNHLSKVTKTLLN